MKTAFFDIDSQLDFLYRAEDHHQNYLVGHTNELYIISYDLPKVAGLKKFFPELYRADPTG